MRKPSGGGRLAHGLRGRVSCPRSRQQSQLLCLPLPVISPKTLSTTFHCATRHLVCEGGARSPLPPLLLSPRGLRPLGHPPRPSARRLVHGGNACPRRPSRGIVRVGAATRFPPLPAAASSTVDAPRGGRPARRLVRGGDVCPDWPSRGLVRGGAATRFPFLHAAASSTADAPRGCRPARRLVREGDVCPLGRLPRPRLLAGGLPLPSPSP